MSAPSRFYEWVPDDTGQVVTYVNVLDVALVIVLPPAMVDSTHYGVGLAFNTGGGVPGTKYFDDEPSAIEEAELWRDRAEVAR